MSHLAHISRGFVGAAAALALLAGCSSRDSDLQEFLERTRKEPPSGVKPLPEVPEYESFAYSAGTLRSPFVPGGVTAGASNRAPDTNRNREFLEQFSLDTLTMVGTLRINGRLYGLVKTRDGLVHRVVPGNYLGQNDGRISDITPARISVIEVVPDGLGGYMERAAALGLNE
jgi:type IV pilus assembly protein PilP